MANGNAPNRVMLRKVLYRIDYQLITEKMQESLSSFVREKYGTFFSSVQQAFENSINIELNPSQLDQSRLNQKAQPVFVFDQPLTSDSDGRQLKIGRTFFLLEISLRVESENIPYYEWMTEIVNQLKTEAMFRFSRIDLRKFNSFFVLSENKDEINNLFSVEYVPKIDSGKFGLERFEDMHIYAYPPYGLNFHKTYSNGTLSNNALQIINQPAHLISFDFDLYTNDLEEMGKFVADAKAGFTHMNSLIYEFFCKVLSAEVIEKINAGDLLRAYKVLPA